MVTLRVESDAGRFSGTSHDGAVVIVRNTNATACELPVLPELSFRDAHGNVVARGVPRGARFLHPGPVLFPLELAPGQVAATTIQWITGDVFDSKAARHASVSALSIALGDSQRTAPLSATVWGEGEPTFAEERFTTALPPLGTRSSPTAGTFVGEGPAGSTYTYGPDQPQQRLTLTRTATNALQFSFAGIAGTAPSTGSIKGTLALHDGLETFNDIASDCHLEISFYETQLVIAQRGTCGFGNGVTAAGQYRAP